MDIGTTRSAEGGVAVAEVTSDKDGASFEEKAFTDWAEDSPLCAVVVLDGPFNDGSDEEELLEWLLWDSH